MDAGESADIGGKGGGPGAVTTNEHAGYTEQFLTGLDHGLIGQVATGHHRGTDGQLFQFAFLLGGGDDHRLGQGFAFTDLLLGQQG